MGFWGIEVKPGKPYPYHADNVRGKLHVTQATLGVGSSNDKSILQCSTGHKSPIFLCSLLPNKIETCPLNLEFDDADLVAFSVIGSRSVHLSGYFVADDEDDLRDDYEYDSLGEDIDGTESDESSEYDSEDDYADDFIVDSDDDMDMYPSTPVPNSGVKIEEIVDDDQPENGDDPTKQSKTKVALLKEKDSKSSELPVVARDETDLVLESEDEDGFPISTVEKGKSVSQKEEAETKREHAHKKNEKANKKEKDVDQSVSLKRKVESSDEDEQLQDGKKKKKKKKSKLKEQGKGESAHASGNSSEKDTPAQDESQPNEVKATTNGNDVKDGPNGQLSKNEVLVEKKNKKKKKKAKENEGEAAANQSTATDENQNLSTSEKKGKKQTESKPSQVRTFPNGLVIEEVSMGKPDGRKATPGKKVSVKYIGKLRKDGKIFDSNVGRAPFKFRLGVGQVIKGWEVGINGMRIGDKRRITIPPSMGYGDKRAGSIPPNSWLVFDVELADVDR